MSGIGVIFLVIAIGIILINFFINLGNITKLVTYCFATNTLDKYWSTFFERMVSHKAVVSSIIGFVVALIIFFIIMPIILIRQSMFKKKVQEHLSSGLFFEYPDIEIRESENKEFHTNLDEIGLEKKGYSISGKLRIDAITALASIKEQCELKNKPIKFEVMQDITLRNSKTAKVPVILNIDNKTYPTYFLYNQMHKDQFKTIRSALFESGYQKCLYFSKDGIIL